MRVMYKVFDPSSIDKIKLAVEEVSYVFRNDEKSLVCITVAARTSYPEYIITFEPISDKDYANIAKSLMIDGFCDLTPYGVFNRNLYCANIDTDEGTDMDEDTDDKV